MRTHAGVCVNQYCLMPSLSSKLIGFPFNLAFSEEAATVFLDGYAKRINEPSHSEDEHRLILLGLSHVLRLGV